MAILANDDKTKKGTGADMAVVADPGENRETQEAFFEISKVVESPEMLQTWVEWFRRLNIPCAIAKVAGGYTLWRKGEEIGRTRAKISTLKRKSIVCSFGL